MKKNEKSRERTPWQEVIDPPGRRISSYKNKIPFKVRSRKGNKYMAWAGPWTKNIPNDISNLVRDDAVKVMACIQFNEKSPNILKFRIEQKRKDWREKIS